MPLTDARARIKAVYAPELFKENADSTTRALTRYLAAAPNAPLKWHKPGDLIALAAKRLKTAGHDYETLIADFIDHAHCLHSPRYVGHQVPPPIPLAGLTEVLASVTNQGLAVFEMGPFSSAVEEAVVAELARRIGWSTGYSGFATSGGTLANLTALITARNVRYPDFWEQGAPAGIRPAVLAASDSHYSVARAVGVLGLGTQQVVKVPLDSKRCMRADSLELAYEQARRDGLDPFAVIAASGSTPIGAFDPLDEIADFASAKKLWLHADGCHGASVVFSKRHRALVKGIDRADSVAWDAHKMLYVPSLSTYVFYKDAANAFKTFAQDAPYLFDPNHPGQAVHDGGIRTFECTKRALSIGLWAAWASYGEGLFEDLVDVTFETTRKFHERVEAAADFEALHVPESNILCFRYLPDWLADAPASKRSEFQAALRTEVIESGDFYLTRTRLDGDLALRVTIMNPLIETGNLDALLDRIRQAGETLRRSI